MADETIGLTLSGGGFRATLFHIGVVRYLRETGLLGRVRRICSVSGGSVLAAHLALYWDDYNGTEERFSMRVGEILRCVRYDVRGRVIRRLPFWLPEYLVGGWPWGRTFLLERQYAASLFGERLMADLKPSPELHIIAASLTERHLYSFSRDGYFRDGHLLTPRNRIPVARVVAASSAFPPLFPPLLVGPRQLLCPPGEVEPQYLTDGGVYDNLGVTTIQRLPPCDDYVVSDAGRTFEVQSGLSYLLPLARAVRVNDVMMSRLAELDLETFPPWKAGRVCKCAIYDAVDTAHFPHAPAGERQYLASIIRTDLNRFSDPEVHSLVEYGYWVAANAVAPLAARHGVASPPAAPAWSPIPEGRRGDANGTELKKSSALPWGLLTLSDRATWLWLLFVTTVLVMVGLWWSGAAPFGKPVLAAVPCEVVEFTPDKARLKEHLPEKLYAFVVESGCDGVTPYEARVSGLSVPRPRSFVVRPTDSQTQFQARFAFRRRPTPGGSEEVLWVKLGPTGKLLVPALDSADELIVVGCLSAPMLPEKLDKLLVLEPVKEP